ncbi:MAG: hypothetical protein DI564_03550 [Rhodanobacter denitrificans]|uniref:EF-hand domain-containing protein n=1 Tax=Rhodanobacter denitrificans TaxID=666685 RepID=A0A2W5KMV8_9GAMM|nr:MAG: hypothetical protein DI564_03550 [Rhodanobacter denitrificans]
MNTPIHAGLLPALAPVALAACLFAASAHAEPGADRAEAVREHLKAADRNGDGYIDRAEADAALPRIAKHFDRLDADGDARLSPAELKAAAEALAARRR